MEVFACGCTRILIGVVSLMAACCTLSDQPPLIGSIRICDLIAVHRPTVIRLSFRCIYLTYHTARRR